MGDSRCWESGACSTEDERKLHHSVFMRALFSFCSWFCFLKTLLNLHRKPAATADFYDKMQFRCNHCNRRNICIKTSSFSVFFEVIVILCFPEDRRMSRMRFWGLIQTVLLHIIFRTLVPGKKSRSRREAVDYICPVL